MKIIIPLSALLIVLSTHAAEPPTATADPFVTQYRATNQHDRRGDDGLTLELGDTNPSLLQDPQFKLEYDRANQASIAASIDAALKENTKQSRLVAGIIIVGGVSVVAALFLTLRKPSTRRARSQKLVLAPGALFFVLTLFNASWRVEKPGTFDSSRKVVRMETSPIWDAPAGASTLQVAPLVLQWVAIGALTGLGAFLLRKKKEGA